MSAESQQGAADRPPLLDLPRIIKLTDAALALSTLLYDLERATRRDARQRAKALARELDLFGAGEHYADHEEYVPAGDER